MMRHLDRRKASTSGGGTGQQMDKARPNDGAIQASRETVTEIAD
jgi:hypothetical protein